VYPLHVVARQRLGKHIPAATNKHATIKELLDAPFSMWPVSYQRKAGDFDPEDRGSAFLANVSEFLQDYTASYQKEVLFIVIAVRILNPTKIKYTHYS
jgi:hypothetical protein